MSLDENQTRNGLTVLTRLAQRQPGARRSVRNAVERGAPANLPSAVAVARESGQPMTQILIDVIQQGSIEAATTILRAIPSDSEALGLVARAAADRLVDLGGSLDNNTHESPLMRAVREQMGLPLVPGVSEPPDSPLGRIRLMTRRAEWLLEAGDGAGGLADAREALVLYESTLRSDVTATPSFLAYSHELCRVLSRCLAAEGHGREAVHYAELALADVRQGCLDAPCGEEAGAMANLGIRLTAVGDLQRAAELMEQAHRQWEKILEAPEWYPDAESERRAGEGRDLHILSDMADVWLLRLLMSTPGEHALAPEDFVFWDYPSTETCLRGAAATAQNLASVHLDLGREAAALALSRRAVDHARLLVEADRDRNVEILGNGLLALAEVLDRLGEDGREPAREAADLYEEAVDRSGGRFRDRHAAAVRLARRAQHEGDPLKRSRRIVESYEGLDAVPGEAVAMLAELSRQLHELARQAESDAQLPLALATLDCAIRAARVVCAHTLGHASLLAAVLNLRSRVLSRLGRGAEAVQDAEEAVTLFG